MFNETPRRRFRGFRLTAPPKDRLGFNDTLRQKLASLRRESSKMEIRSCVHGAKILIDKLTLPLVTSIKNCCRKDLNRRCIAIENGMSECQSLAKFVPRAGFIGMSVDSEICSPIASLSECQSPAFGGLMPWDIAIQVTPALVTSSNHCV